MPSELKNLATIFGNSLFRIPDYQRGYAWGRLELEDFWQDLDRLADGRKHYTGQLTLESVDRQVWSRWDESWLIDGQGRQVFYIVDGQQRIATIIVLIKCLLEELTSGVETIAFQSRADIEKRYLIERANESLSACIFGYEKDNPSHEYFKTRILGLSSNQNQHTETLYTANLGEARAFFESRLKNATYEKLEQWYKSLTQRFVFSIYELDDDLDVCVAFETMNNRGKGLSKLELLKNRLIYLSTLVPSPTQDHERKALRANVNDAWKTAYEFLGRKKGQSLDDDSFLRAHWTMFFNYSRDGAEQFSSYLLNEKFTSKGVLSGRVTPAYLQSYVTSIQDSVRVWYDLHFPSDATNVPDAAKPWLERFTRLGYGAFAPLLMAAFQKNVPTTKLERLLRAAERFVFVIKRLCGRRADAGDSVFYRMADWVFGGRSIDDAIDAVLEQTKKHYAIHRVKAQMADQNEGFYGWGGIHYLLFEYEQHLQTAAAMSTSKLRWDSFNVSKSDRVSIEHIYPRSSKAGEWPEFDALSEANRQKHLQSLGNLVALSTRRNSKLSNRSFAEKCIDATGAIGYQSGSFSEIEVSKAVTWTPQNVRDRGLAILRFLESRWEISLGTDVDKIEILGL